MPYIKPEQRTGIDEGTVFPQNCGELNYLITLIVHQYIEEHKLCYVTLNEVMGVLECAKQELYRMVTAPYEDKKKEENGSVSNLDDNSHEEMR